MATMWSDAEVDELRQVGLDAGLAAVGTCAIGSWTHTRGLLEARRSEGLAGGMAFTYRKPARSSEPGRIIRNARSLVVGAWSYAQAVPDAPRPASARVARYATADHYGRMDAALTRVAEHLRARGHRCVVTSDDNALVDREAAWRAGIGSSGKNSNILLPGLGSWFVLGSVVTDAELPTLCPPEPDACGACRRCLDGCPTGAILAPGVVDARRCLAWMLQAPGEFPHEWRVTLGDRLYGCDDCQEVCPPNRRADSAASATAAAATAAAAPEDEPGAWVNANEVIGQTDDELLERFGRWYIPARDPSVLRRNLLLVVGNSAAPEAPGVADTLATHLRHPDDVVAATAAWAAMRLSLPALLDDAAVAERPAVRSELPASVGAQVAAAGRADEDSRP